jgi:hypothetical protein
MCDYSLHVVSSRPARLGEVLTTTRFPMTSTRGFAAADAPNVAVCVMPGTELAFEQDVLWDRPFAFLRRRPIAGKLVSFRQVDPDERHAHHDAVEFPDGRTVLLTALRPGQRATVVQLPPGRRESVPGHARPDEVRAKPIVAARRAGSLSAPTASAR